LQTLYYNFSGSEESVYIFSTLNAEPWGRIGCGVAELISSILILMPKTRFIDAIMSIGIISGAMLLHFTVLGIKVQNDRGYLFLLSLVVFVFSCLTVFLDNSALKSFIINKIQKNKS